MDSLCMKGVFEQRGLIFTASTLFQHARLNFVHNCCFQKNFETVTTYQIYCSGARVVVKHVSTLDSY